MFSLCTRSYHDTRRWRDASRCNSEHFDFLDPRPPWPCLSESRYGAVGKIGLHTEFSRSPWAHAHSTLQGSGVTPPGAIRNTLIFWTPDRHGTWLSASRYGAVGKICLHMEFSWSPCAHAHTTIQGGGVMPPGAIRNTLIFWTPACHGTCLSASRYGVVGKIGLHMEFSRSPWVHAHTTIQRGGVTPPGAIRNTLIFWTPARQGRALARQDTVPRAKLAYTWNFHVLLVHTLIPRYMEVA
ncbi:hypothetical protein QL285_058513 [Trifolium repens]|nr:hypothetical protein QL285_058513 [Trifolium repens]